MARKRYQIRMMMVMCQRTCRQLGLLPFFILLVLLTMIPFLVFFNVTPVDEFLPPSNGFSLPKEFVSPSHTKVPSLEYCSRRIEENVLFYNLTGRSPPPSSARKLSDYEVFKALSQLSCQEIVALIASSQPNEQETHFPLAYVLLLYKGAGLLVKQLQFIYMPQNIYCIHIDTSASLEFVNAVESVVRCLPNVFITKRRVKVIYLHVSTVRAQLNCIEDLLENPVPWRYLLNVCGQDFPLYSNRGIVQALKALKGRTNAESCEVKSNEAKKRTKNVHELKRVTGTGQAGHGAYILARTGKDKTPAPYGIKIFKGSSYIAGSREFCRFAAYEEPAKAFLEWLNDTRCADESFFASLYRYPGISGGAPDGRQAEFITRGAVRWYKAKRPEDRCYGHWLREICVLSLADLSWLFEPKLENMLFIQKIDFDYDNELVDCLYVKVQSRRQHPLSNKEINWYDPCEV
ncbi:N-acetyllactosaminide beta-1,6-N-acetylglucosaminyl-transferase-like [Montipora foliosa]|uniref:N-acetyllactosaminide beta-1,6-N-acetylglucosaminyl-transferase-like n=1 Tax=Montipora foliosa TaxID=591990 RepID=UPI0035F20937